jgi:hypothetical protein
MDGSMATAPPPTLLSVLRQRVVRLQLAVGIGGLAAVLGGLVAAPVVAALLPWAQTHRSSWKVTLVHTLLSRMWVYFILPVLWFLVARLSPRAGAWSNAVGSAVTGELLYLALDWLGGNLPQLIHSPVLWAPRLVTLTIGIVTTQRAISSARPS